MSGTGDEVWVHEPVTWETVTATLRYPGGEAVGRVTARRFVAETRLALAAPGAVVFERAYTNAPGDVVPMGFSSLRATAAWATAEAGTVRLSCEPEGAFAAVAGGVRTALPCAWASARDAADSREIALEGGAALAEAGTVAKLTLAFEPDVGGAAVEETAEIRAYELRVEAAAEWPSNRVRHVFGPLEEAELSIEPSSASVKWKVDSDGEKGPNFKYTAAPVPKKTEGVVSVVGVSFAFNLETIAPDRLQAGGFRATEDWDWHVIAFAAPQDGEIGVGLAITNIVLLPDWVSFANVDIREGFCLATNMWGIFNFPNAQSKLYSHGAGEGAGEIMAVSGANEIGNDFAAISFKSIRQPWRRGGFQYDIPLYWRARGDSGASLWRLFDMESQVFTFEANGEMTVEKFGGAVTRGTNGVSRIRKE